MKIFHTIIILILFSGSVLAQGGAQTCNELQTNPQLYQSCATSVPFNNQTVGNTENINPSCFLEPIKAPTWFFIKVKNSGDINLQISQISNMGNGLDVDFCLWGPFTSVSNVCGQLIPSNEVDCSWLPASVENVEILNAVQNQIYILLVDNYAQIAGTISISQTGGSGSSDCSFLSSVKIKNTDDTLINQFNYCKPQTKTLKAVVDVTDFTANVVNLRFNYRWKKDGVIVQTTNNSLSNTNLFTASETGLYQVDIAVYDVTDTSIDINNIPFPNDQSAEIELKFYDTPVLTTTPISVDQCDFISPNNDGFAIFDLTQYYNQLTNSTSGIALKYYRDVNLTQEILNPTSFTNSVAFAQTIYVVGEISSNPIVCKSNIAQINLNITPTSTTTYPDVLPVCKVLNLSYGLIDFEEQRVTIKNNFFPTTVVDIQFYLSQNDVSLEQNPLQNSTQLSAGIITIFTKVKSGNNCISIGTFLIEIKESPLLNVITNFSRCANDNLILNTFDSQALLNQNSSVQPTYFYTLDNATNNVNSIDKNSNFSLGLGQTTIYVRLYNSSSQCFSIISFTISTFARPSVNPNPAIYNACGNTIATFNLNSRISNLIGSNSFQVNFYETLSDLNNNTPILNPTTYSSNSRIIFVKVVDATAANCSSQTTLQLVVNPKPGSNIDPSPFVICDSDGFSTFNLNDKETEMAGSSALSTLVFKYYVNEIDALQNNNLTIGNPNNFTNITKNYQIIYVRINSTNPAVDCFSILKIAIFVSEFPVNNLMNLPYGICTSADGSVNEEAFVDTKLNMQDYTFVWYTDFDAVPGNEIAGQTSSSFSTPLEGEFSVKITNISTPAACFTVVNFTSKNTVIPRNLSFTPSEIIAFEQNQQIVVVANPPSDEYEYLLNFGNWQSSPIFRDFAVGINKIEVRNKFGCETIEKTFLVADFKNFFTPNGDGYNDLWKIEGDAALDKSTTYIYDKFGKLLYEHKKSSQGWDGNYEGRAMPSDDYWFTIRYTNNNEEREFRGHFSLKR